MNFDIRVNRVKALFYAFDSAVEYTTKLQRERHAMQEEADQLRKQIQDLNTSIRYYVIYIKNAKKAVSRTPRDLRAVRPRDARNNGISLRRDNFRPRFAGSLLPLGWKKNKGLLIV